MNKSRLIVLISILFLLFTNLYSQELKIAIGQIMCIDSDRSGNIVRIENAIKEAKFAGADIITFPETSIYGWVNPEAHKIASTIPGRDSEGIMQTG